MPEGYVEAIRNLATNPSFERAVAGSTVVRRNLAVDPRGTTLSIGSGPRIANSRWSTDGSYSLVTGLTGIPSGITTAVAFTVSTARAGHGFDLADNPEGGGGALNRMIPVVPGEAVTISVWVRKSGASIPLYITTRATDSAGAWIVGTVVNSTDVASAAGSWIRVSVTRTAPAGAAYIAAALRGSTTADNVGDVWMGTGLLVEKRPALLPYFDGSTTDSTGIAYSWEGTADASASVAKAAVTEVRRNRHPNPQADAAWVSQPGTGGAATDTFENGLRKSTWTTEATGGNARVYTGIPITAVPGETLTISVDVAASGGQVTLLADWLVGSTWVALNTSPVVTPSASTAAPSRLSFTVTAPASGIDNLRLYVRWTATASASPGNWIAAGRALVETGSTLASYLDGNVTPDADLTPAWTGAENASASVLYGTCVENTPALPGGGRIVFYSWARSCVRADSSVNPNTANGILVGATPVYSQWEMVAGKTYTVLAKLILPVPQSGDYPASRRIFTLNTADGQSAQAPNMAGEHWVRFIFTSTSSQNTVRLAQAPAGESIYWDQLLVVEGSYTGPYFDGDSPSTSNEVLYRWVGAPNASASVKDVAAYLSTDDLMQRYFNALVPGGLDEIVRTYGSEHGYWASRSGLTPAFYYSTVDHKMETMRNALGITNRLSSQSDLEAMFYRQYIP